ncbi:MAG TPA: phage tail tape measure protein [Halomonas sp.]|nr:phage tail tape measure protein [Halomonas sp.]
MAYESRLSLTVDSRTGEQRLRSFRGELNQTERAGKLTGAAMGKLASAISLAAAAAGGFGLSRVIRETTDFDSALRGLQATSRASARDMKALEDQARTLGATTMFSAKQTADAQQFLAMAGFEVNQILGATPAVLKLATAANMDLASAADIASNVLGGMRLQVEDLDRVVDVLAATTSGSNTNIGQLGQALAYAAPLAASASIEIEETAAAIGVLSDAGLQGSKAGTGLVGVIRQLSNVTPVAEEALARYGLSVADVDIAVHGLSSVLDTLQKANISTSDAFKVFGSEAGAAAQILANGSQRVREFTGDLTEAEGAASAMAQIIGGGLAGSWASFNSALSESILRLGRDQGVASGFQSVVDTATGVISVYNDMLPQFAEANDLTEDQADNLQMLADGLETVGTVAVLAIGGKLAGSAAAAGCVPPCASPVA